MIETERLVMRVPSIDDYEGSAAMWADPEVVRHIGGTPQPREQVWARFLKYVGHWAVSGFGYWVIRDRADRFVGEVGFADHKRGLVAALDGLPEVGWALASWAHGLGLATEAVRAAVSWGDAHLPSPHTWCMIDLGHQASMRVAEKCGYRERERASYHGVSTLIYERLWR